MKNIKIDKIDKSIFSNLDLSIMFKSSNVVQPFLMFYEVNKEVGNRINFYNTKCDDLLNALVEDYNIDKKDIISTQYLNKKTGQYGYSSFLITLTKNLWVFHGAPDHEQEGTSIIYSSETSQEDLLNIQTIKKWNWKLNKSFLSILFHNFNLLKAVFVLSDFAQTRAEKHLLFPITFIALLLKIIKETIERSFEIEQGENTSNKFAD